MKLLVLTGAQHVGVLFRGHRRKAMRIRCLLDVVPQDRYQISSVTL